MKQLIMTSPKFSGEITVLYGTDDQLIMIDMQQAELKASQVKAFKEAIPVFLSDEMPELFKSFTIIKKGYMFWDAYNKKRNRDRAEKLWDKMSEVNKAKAYLGLNLYNRYCELNVSWYNKLDPENYLRNQSWNNEWK
jgi:hypothetical protein